MLDDGDNDASGIVPRDPSSVYRSYLRTCKRLGVRPVLRDRARKHIEEWTDTIAASRSVPPTQH